MKLRYSTWWWGRWIRKSGARWADESGNTFPSGQVNVNEFEPYNKQAHGRHNEFSRVEQREVQQSLGRGSNEDTSEELEG